MNKSDKDVNQLAQLTCEACQVGCQRLESHQISPLLAQLPSWELVERYGILQLLKEFQFKNFANALDFTNQIGELAEIQDHHPAILTEWGKVTIRWWTHKIKGLHQNDFICAAKTSQLFDNFKTTR